RRFLSSKGPAWLELLDLPRRTSWEMVQGMQSMPRELSQRFESHGWRMVDPEQATLTCQAYQKFIQQSAGEFTVVKGIYSGIPSGWFSDRSAAYLASGRPVVAQGSGFDRWLPTGEG